MNNKTSHIHCYRCREKIEHRVKIFKADECPKCLADIRVCKMCSFYDISAYNECREPGAERVVDKEKANFCDYFRLNDSSKESSLVSSESLKKAADALFKN